MSKRQAFQEIIERLRSHGIGRNVDLPQLIVCGDQSSGKSSVLEAVSSCKFPAKDGLCTRFPTELVMRNSKQESLSATIIPAPDRPETEQQQLRAFRPSIPSMKHDSFAQLVGEAADVMGLGPKDVKGRAFGRDVLRVEFAGPQLPFLTLVDLPGSFHGSGEDQNQKDVTMVADMIKEYMSKPRTIILAIVAASSELAGQVVTTFVAEKDPGGERTLGVITKPDTLGDRPTSTQHFLKLLRNETYNLQYRLGWHVLRNRGNVDQASTSAERDRQETKFFSRGLWRDVPDDRKGIDSLNIKLEEILQGQLATTLPGLTKDVGDKIKKAEAESTKLKVTSMSISDGREKLHLISERFSNLLTEALSGDHRLLYTHCFDPRFNDATNLRRTIDDLIDSLREELTSKGAQVNLVESGPYPSEYRVTVAEKTRRACHTPGRIEPVLITDLFHDQTVAWPVIVRRFVNALLDRLERCLFSLIRATEGEGTADKIIDVIIRPQWTTLKSQFEERTQEKISTYHAGKEVSLNRKMTQSIPAARAREVRRVLEEGYQIIAESSGTAGGLCSPNLDLMKLFEGLEIHRLASIDAIACMDWLYKVYPASGEQVFELIRAADRAGQIAHAVRLPHDRQRASCRAA